MWTSLGDWIAKWFSSTAPQKADFESLAEQQRRWGADLAAHYKLLNEAQAGRIEALELAAARYREWTERRIRQLEAAEEQCGKDRDAAEGRIRLLESERDAALGRIVCLESTVAELQSQVKYLLETKRPEGGPC